MDEKQQDNLIPVWIERAVVRYRTNIALVTEDGKYEVQHAKVTFSKKKGKAWGIDSEWSQRSLSIPKEIKDLSQTFVCFEQREDETWIAVFYKPIPEYDIIKSRV